MQGQAVTEDHAADAAIAPGDLVRIRGYEVDDDEDRVLGVVGQQWPLEDRYRVELEHPQGRERITGGWYARSELELVLRQFARVPPEPPAERRRMRPRKRAAERSQP